MLAIDEIEVVEPRQRISLSDDFARLGLDTHRARVFSRLYGFDKVPVAEPGEEFAILTAAVDSLLERTGIDPARIGVLLHAHTGPYIGPVGDSLPRELLRRLGDHVLAFGTQLHKCVASLTALRVIDRLLAHRPPGTQALLLVGECADSKDLRILEMGVSGDIACAILLSRDGTRDRVLSETVAVHGQYAAGIYAEPDADQRRAYEASFQQHLRDVILATLDRAGVPPQQVRYLLPHNVNVHVWKKAVAELGIPADRLHLGNVARFAHCFGADVFLNLAAIRARFRSGDHYLMASVGVGGTFGAALLRH